MTSQTSPSIKHPHTPGQPGEYAEAGAKAVRPKDAATLILVRHDDMAPRILMGKRAPTHKFMPNKFVFPGGKVDPADSRLKLTQTLRAPVMRRLQKHSSITKARLRGLALAAIRETFEETGIVLGHETRHPLKSTHKEWRDYFTHNVAPPLKEMDFIARAITPTYRTRRFDTRFFLCDAAHIYNDLEDTTRASGELSDLHWLTPDDAYALDLPLITREVITLVKKRITLPPAKRFSASAPFIRFRHGKTIRSLL